MKPKSKKKKPEKIDLNLSDKIINYRKLIDKNTEGFVGREWLINEVDDFLKNDKHRYFLILGEPGCGKTAFMAELVRRNRYRLHHFIGMGSQICESYSKDWCDPVCFAESVGYQLVRNYGGWIMNWDYWGIDVKQNVKELEGLLIGAKIGKYKATPSLYNKAMLTVEQEVERYGSAAKVVGVYIAEWNTEIEQIVRVLLKTPLYNIAKKWPKDQFFVIIDGLDEATNYSCQDRTIFKMLPNGSLPSNIRFLLSSTAGKHLQKNFLSQAHVFWLSEDENGKRDPRTLEDARAYVKRLAEEDSIKAMLKKYGISKNEFIKRVVSASECNFLYLHHYAQELRNGDETLLKVNALPRGLYGIYENFLCKIRDKQKKEKFWDGAYKPVLAILAVAREPLSRKQISDFSNKVKQGTVGTILISIKQFLDVFGKHTVDRRYKIYHRTFCEYLVSEDNEDYIDAQEAHEKIVNYYSSRKGSWEENYAMKYLISHMIAAQSWDDLGKLLTDIEYLKKKQSPKEQYRFQNDFINLLKNQEISTAKLVSILEEILNVIIEKLENGKEKADWLDIFSYWINEFGKSGSEERKTALKKVANKFDYACGSVSKELAIKYEEEGEHDWALRFAELCTWVYQRAEDYQKCAEACEFAEKMCLKEVMEEAYRLLGRAEFIRMRARALTKLSKMETDKNKKETYDSQAHKAYQELNDVFKFDKQDKWEPKEQEWQRLEEDTGELLTPPLTDKKSSKVQVVSNAHDSISAMYIIQTFKKYGMNVDWIHTTKFQPKDLAPQNIELTILIGGPKSPGISNVAQKFHEADKEGFLELYSARGMVAKVLKMKEGKTQCYMVGGPSKINTLKAAYNFTRDPEVISFLK